jgi:uncharacterized membrane protein
MLAGCRVENLTGDDRIWTVLRGLVTSALLAAADKVAEAFTIVLASRSSRLALGQARSGCSAGGPGRFGAGVGPRRPAGIMVDLLRLVVGGLLLIFGLQCLLRHAEVYADRFISVHHERIGGGKTYSQLLSGHLPAQRSSPTRKGRNSVQGRN